MRPWPKCDDVDKLKNLYKNLKNVRFKLFSIKIHDHLCEVATCTDTQRIKRDEII